jgi:tetratricopeptide (TPR) repeat protein
LALLKPCFRRSHGTHFYRSPAKRNLHEKVDSIAEEKKEAKKPWYKNISTAISVAAFLFSFGTTIISYKRADDQDVHNLKSELRGILQRLAALPKENVEISQKYATQPATIGLLSGYVNQENLLLAKQAGEIIKRLPNTQVSATDYFAVATALGQSREFAAAMLHFNSALAVSSSLDDETATLRSLAGLEMMAGKKDEARAHFQQAIDIFEKYKMYDDYTKNSTNFLTELIWASTEASARNIEAATLHLHAAEQLLKKLPDGGQTQVFNGQLAQLKNAMSAPPQAPSIIPLPVTQSGQIPGLMPQTAPAPASPAKNGR